MPSSIILQTGMPQGAGAGLLFFAFLALIFIIIAALVLWTYRDAQKNSSHPPFLWAIVVFLAPLLGFVLYLLLGRTER